jgi:L-glyceraldehyde 3-phosphate reductase
MAHDDNLARVRGLAGVARERGQSLAQMAISWTLRDPRVTSTLLGASSADQLRETAAAAQRLDFTPAEIGAIDEYAVEAGIDLWRSQSRFD